MKYRARCSPLPIVAALALIFSVVSHRAQAQALNPSFSSFGMVTLSKGYLFQINGVNVTTANQVGTSGDYAFGFSTAFTAITVNFSGANSSFGIGPGGGTDTLTAIDAVYLVQNGPNDGKDSVTATVNGSGAAITSYNGTAAGTWTGGLASGADFPYYASGNFTTSSYLRKGGTLNQRYGDFSFTNISSSANATGPIYFGFYARDTAGHTGFLMAGFGPVPEPAFVQLGGLLAMGGLGSAFRFLRRRRAM